MDTAPVTSGRSPQRSEQRLERPTNQGRNPDIFWFDQSLIPDGMAYQWMVVTLLGQENKQHMIEMARFHWKPVPSSRHPEIAGESGAGSGDQPIIVGGQMLMERPQYLNDESRAEERKASLGQVNSQMQRLGQAPVGTMERVSPSVNRTMERGQPVDD